MPGCACEPDGEGGARICLDCFRSVYGCPTYAELFLAYPGEALPDDIDPTASLHSVAAQSDACGQLWFSPAIFSRPRYAFAADSGVLVGATASHGAPLTAPCGTYRVSAGAAMDCAETERWGCYVSGSFDSCDEAEWLRALAP